MPKVTSPFFSIGAKGTISNLLTAYKHSGRSYLLARKSARGLFVGPVSGFGRMFFGGSFFGYHGTLNPKTQKQEQGARRYVFAEVWKAYEELTPEQKNFYKESAKSKNMTGPNLFMSEYLLSNLN